MLRQIRSPLEDWRGGCLGQYQALLWYQIGQREETSLHCSHNAVERVVDTPGKLRPTPNGDLTTNEVKSGDAPHNFRAEDIDREQRPEAADTSGQDEPTLLPDDLRATKRIRITLKDVKQHGYTGGPSLCRTGIWR